MTFGVIIGFIICIGSLTVAGIKIIGLEDTVKLQQALCESLSYRAEEFKKEPRAEIRTLSEGHANLARLIDDLQRKVGNGVETVTFFLGRLHSDPVSLTDDLNKVKCDLARLADVLGYEYHQQTSTEGYIKKGGKKCKK